MSFGLTATLLLRLDAHMGEWLTVIDLGNHCAVHPDLVVLELENLVANGLVHVDRHRHTGEIFAAMCNVEGAYA